MRCTRYCVTNALGSGSTVSPPRNAEASIKARCPSGWCSRARRGSSGRAQPCSQFQASRKAPKVFCHPGGDGLKLLPVSRSTRATSKCTWHPPFASRCSTAVQAIRAGSSSPAVKARSRSSSTPEISASVGRSSGDQATTPDRYRCTKSSESATLATIDGEPRSTVTSSRSRPRWSFSASR